MSAYEGRSFAAPAPCVASVRGLERAAPSPAPLTVPFLPSGSSSLVVHDTHGRLDVIFAGPRTVAKYRHYRPATFFVQLVLAPGAARGVIGRPVAELTDGAISVDDAWGSRGRALRERLAACEGDVAATVAEVAKALPRLDAAPLVAAAVRELERGASVGALATRLGISERALRRAFTEHVGISPKRHARIARIQRAVRDAGRLGWAELAAEHGFCDQAHLSAEFRALLRVSPSAFLKRRFPLSR